jgi:hypothetical protein
MKYRPPSPHERLIGPDAGRWQVDYRLDTRRRSRKEPLPLCDSERTKVLSFNRMDDPSSHSKVVNRALCGQRKRATVIIDT